MINKQVIRNLVTRTVIFFLYRTMGRYARCRKSNFICQSQSKCKRNIAIKEITENNTQKSNFTRQVRNKRNNCLLWWDKLSITNNNCTRVYSPKWNRVCSGCGS